MSMNEPGEGLWQVVRGINLTDRDFVLNLESGIILMAVEIVLVSLILRQLLIFWENRRWSKTRQQLAYVLLGSINRMAQHTENMLHVFGPAVKNPDEVEHSGEIVINSQFELHLLKATVALANFNEQTIVHLPALLPDNTENLSGITRKISGLEESVAALKYHFSNIKPSLKTIDSRADLLASNEALHWIGPERFSIENEPASAQGGMQRLHLRPEAAQTDYNYFVLTYVKILERTCSLAMEISSIIEDHSGWTQLSDRDRKKAPNQQDVLKQRVNSAVAIWSSIVTNGLYLTLYTPVAADLERHEDYSA
jgi:hypothetical protein